MDKAEKELNRDLGAIFRQLAKEIEAGLLNYEDGKALFELLSTAMDLIINIANYEKGKVSKYEISNKYINTN